MNGNGRPSLAESLTRQVSEGTLPITGTEVIVETADLEIAKVLAPSVAKVLHPGRLFGRVLYGEQHEDHWHMVVEDRGPDRRAVD